MTLSVCAGYMQAAASRDMIMSMRAQWTYRHLEFSHGW